METYRVERDNEDEMSGNQSPETNVNSVESQDLDVYAVGELALPYGIEEKENEVIFLEPGIGEGKRLLADKLTTIPQLFALMRQFVSPVCENIGLIVDEMLRRGVGINSIDSTTGMSMLHYAIQACALSGKHALSVVKRLLRDGADSNQRGVYSGMNSLHLAAYFDLPSVATVLLDNKYSVVEIESLCHTFDYGTSLHIAASCLSYSTVQVLLQNGASVTAQNDAGLTPLLSIPLQSSNEEDATKAEKIQTLIENFVPASYSKQVTKYKALLGSMVGFSVPKKEGGVTVSFDKMTGILRYVGSLPSSSVEWAGIELDSPKGKNNGTLAGRTYFRCKPDYGIFVPLSNIAVQGKETVRQSSSRKSTSKGRRKKSESPEFSVGDRVSVAKSKTGTVRFIGKTQFASGTWCGIELDDGNTGKSDGSIDGVRYFKCPESKGIFALPSMLTNLDLTPTESGPTDVLSSHPSKQRELLQPGLTVDIQGNKKQQTAVIRFVGETKFAAGVWVGLELSAATGRNDGSVKGTRYFSCQPNHGIMLRPSRVWYRGVNGDHLLP
uniref:CAP-Gly domain-containing linker protein 4-like n=1 Tax=Ciona intestinalis TaxID=7719 RepID=UPI000180C751|nr:CAP-Gly domain-containing linker protein 4-like [Ciona intestinalis]|eukprot:XP_026690408.1 CAP-Gly domain-containing linker protein 4-like [Ciona intestinalis]